MCFVTGCTFLCGRMSGEENPAAEPAAAIDVQGDGRWMSQVRVHVCLSVCVCVY